jgi:hypothetical protein
MNFLKFNMKLKNLYLLNSFYLKKLRMLHELRMQCDYIYICIEIKMFSLVSQILFV